MVTAGGALVLSGQPARAAEIQNISVAAITDASATISWDSTTPGTSRTEYGPTISYGSLTSERPLSYFHETTLTGLTAGTLYHFRIWSRDRQSNVTVSGDLTFTTRTRAQLEAVIRAARQDGGLAKTYYVSSSGDDNNDGLSIATAWRHPSVAVSRSDVGDTIRVLDGTWPDEEVVFPRSGIDVAPITLMAHSGQPTVTGITIGTFTGADARSCINVAGFRASGGISARGGEHVHVSDCDVPDIYFVDIKHASISRCNVHDSPWNSIMIQANYRTDAGHISVVDNRVHDNPGSSGEEGHNLLDFFSYDQELFYLEVSGNVLYNGLQAGIFTHEGNPDRPYKRYLMIRNNVVSNVFQNLVGSLDQATVTNNVFYGHVSSGFEVWPIQPSFGVAIVNNIVVNNGIGINAENPSFVCAFNNAWGNSSGDFRCPAGPGNMSANPLFFDPANGDFHLRSEAGRWNGTAWVLDPDTSPCIDRGDPASPYEWEPAPNGGRINMGAYGGTAEASKSPTDLIFKDGFESGATSTPWHPAARPSPLSGPGSS